MLKNDLVPKIRITDAYLIENNILKKSDLAPIKLQDVHSDIQVEDVKQGAIGNCYLLTGLGNIIKSCPDLINKIIKVTEEGIEVTLHDANDPSNTFIYVIDPTKVTMSRYSHDTLFILEKAYAIHRIIKEKQFDDNELVILEKLHDNQFDVPKTYQDLSGVNLNSVKVTKELIEGVKKKYDKYLSYEEALDRGHVSSVYAAFLGIQAVNDPIPEDYNAEYLFTNFITQIITFRETLNGWDKESKEKELLIKIFGAIDSPEAIFFINALTMPFYIETAAKLNALFEAKGTASTVQEDIHQVIKELFNKAIEQAGEGEVMKNTLLQFNAFVDREIPHKRGLGIYTPSQLNAYHSIKTKLQNSQMISLSSRKEVGRDPTNQVMFAGEPISKGLAGEHAYQVVNCYERAHLKFILIRNPWGSYVRHYIPKQKILGGKKVTVLSAQNVHNNDSIFLQMHNFFMDQQPIISQAALPLTDKKYRSSYKGNGYFEIELTDLTKRFRLIYASDKIIDMPMPKNDILNSKNP